VRKLDAILTGMDERNDYRKSAKDAHKRANQAAESSRLHSNDLGHMLHSAKSAHGRLTDGQDRQRKREQNPGRSISSLRTARFQAMESQLRSAFNYCLTAENAVGVLGRLETARRAIERARHVAEVVRGHVNEPNHVPGDSVEIINQRLAELERRISGIEARFA